MTMAPPEAPPAATLDGLIAGLTAAVEQNIGRKNMQVGFRHDPSGSPATTGYLHGPGGQLSYPGVDQDVLHTVVGARGIIGQLPVRASLDTNPLFAVITGVTDTTGSEKTEVCDDAPIAGIIQTCYVSSQFARYERQTAQIEINRLGQRNDRADPMDLRMIGSPISNTGLFLQSGPAAVGGGAPEDVLEGLRGYFVQAADFLARAQATQPGGMTAGAMPLPPGDLPAPTGEPIPGPPMTSPQQVPSAGPPTMIAAGPAAA